MDHYTDRAAGRNDYDRIYEHWVRAGLIGAGDRPRLLAALRTRSPDALVRSISDAYARRVFDSMLTNLRSVSQILSDEPARFSLFEEFLVPEELTQLTNYTLSHENQFRTSQVISHTSNEGKTDYTHRRSRVLFALGPFQELVANRLRCYLPQIFRALQHSPFDLSSVEAQITATNDGEYFRTHNDNTHNALVTREITYVLFFHREPKAFTGGELRLYDSRFEKGRYVAGRAYTSVTPQQNMVVFFPSYFMHEVVTVRCPSRAFANSRFTLNGWLHR
jgi:Rps23 Pro-64 3,4-dihydroxylase Tpa1-like proline 4-hydroxylase